MAKKKSKKCDLCGVTNDSDYDVVMFYGVECCGRDICILCSKLLHIGEDVRLCCRECFEIFRELGGK